MNSQTSVAQRCPVSADYNPFDPAQLEPLSTDPSAPLGKGD